ncbi:hypothetical protein GS682_06835 [Nostoc sp. B(2019)]|nr:hypothetical protein [Nostoc sp. B(2019)]
MQGLVPLVSSLVQFSQRLLKQQLHYCGDVWQRSQINWDYAIKVWNVVMMMHIVHLRWFC